MCQFYGHTKFSNTLRQNQWKECDYFAFTCHLTIKLNWKYLRMMQLAMVKKDLKINTSYLKENVSLKNNFILLIFKYKYL